MQLYFVRHGESENNVMPNQAHDPSLTEIGKTQAALVADYLANTMNIEELVLHPTDSTERAQIGKFEFTHLYCSPMCRALQTAQPISKALGMKPEVWIDIHEHGGVHLKVDGVIHGFGGKTRSEMLAEFPDYVLPDAITEDGWWHPQDGQESIDLCMARAMRAASKLRTWARDEKSADDVVIIVTHATFLDRLIKAIMNMLPGIHHMHWHYNTAITRIDILTDGMAIIRYINRAEHLTPEITTGHWRV